jgi:hypothetical protein
MARREEPGSLNGPSRALPHCVDRRGIAETSIFPALPRLERGTTLGDHQIFRHCGAYLAEMFLGFLTFLETSTA